MTEHYEIYAVQYGRYAGRRRSETFITIDPHDVAIQPLNYYVWVIRNANRTIMVDAGFEHGEAQNRGRKVDRLPREGLAMIGIDAAELSDVILTHLHYDHAGTLDDYPKARFHLQETEMAYATGKCMCFPVLKAPYSAEHIVQAVRKLYDGKLVFHNGEAEFAPGITLHLIGGHAKGIMCVRVMTGRGWVVLASDTTHFYENVETDRPFVIVHDVEAVLRGYERLRALAGGKFTHIIPGHDMAVMDRYPAPDPRLEGVIARLDVEPSS